MLNENLFDRLTRVMLGLVLVSLAIWGPQTPWGYVGVIFLATGMIGFCPIYKAFGISTLQKKS